VPPHIFYLFRAEALDASSALHKEEFADDIAITSMARLWDVGKSEPIKVGKASPTEGALPAALYFAIKYHRLATSSASASTTGGFEEALVANANCGGDRYAWLQPHCTTRHTHS